MDTWMRSLATARRVIFLQNILWEVIAKLILNNVPNVLSQNIDILARINGNVFPWQRSIIKNKSLFY